MGCTVSFFPFFLKASSTTRFKSSDVYYSGDEGIMPRSTNITEIEQQIYGVPSGNQYFERVDHCSFPDMNRIATDW